MKKWKVFGITLILSASVLAACNKDEVKTTSADEQDKVIQYQSLAGQILVPEVAQELGYLEDITLESVGSYAGGPESIQFVATDQIDFGWAFAGAVLKAAEKNVAIQSVIAGYGSDENTATGLYVLEDSGIDSAEDLVDKKVGVNILGAHFEFFLKDYLRQGGLSEEQIKEISPVIIPVSSAEQALRNGQVDAIVMGGLARDLAVERGGIKALARDVDVYERDFTGPIFFSDKFIEENPNTVQTFVEGSAKAIDWLQNASQEEVIALYKSIYNKRGEEESIENTRFYKSYGISSKGGLLTDDDFSIWLEALEAEGTIKKDVVNIAELYTNEFNPFEEDK